MGMSPTLMKPRNSFTPKSIAGLQLWLDASDSSTVTLNGSNVSQWNDKSGNGRNATQGTANNQPTYATAGRNSRNIITFDGTSDSMLTNDYTIAQPHTLFVVGRRAVGGANQNFTDGGSAGRAAVYWANTDNWGMFGGVALTGPAGTDTNWHVFAASFNTTSSTLRLDGSTIATGTAGTESYTGLRIGGYNATLALLNGSIAEIISYSGSLSAANRSLVERWLGGKWGVTIA